MLGDHASERVFRDLRYRNAHGSPSDRWHCRISRMCKGGFQGRVGTAVYLPCNRARISPERSRNGVPWQGRWNRAPRVNATVAPDVETISANVKASNHAAAFAWRPVSFPGWGGRGPARASWRRGGPLPGGISRRARPGGAAGTVFRPSAWCVPRASCRRCVHVSDLVPEGRVGPSRYRRLERSQRRSALARSVSFKPRADSANLLLLGDPLPCFGFVIEGVDDPELSSLFANHHIAHSTVLAEPDAIGGLPHECPLSDFLAMVRSPRRQHCLRTLRGEPWPMPDCSPGL